MPKVSRFHKATCSVAALNKVLSEKSCPPLHQQPPDHPLSLVSFTFDMKMTHTCDFACRKYRNVVALDNCSLNKLLKKWIGTNPSQVDQKKKMPGRHLDSLVSVLILKFPGLLDRVLTRCDKSSYLSLPIESEVLCNVTANQIIFDVWYTVMCSEMVTSEEVWDLRASVDSWCHHREAQNHSPERFHSPFLAGGINFPPSSGTLNSWQFSSDTWKLISSVITWLRLKKILHSRSAKIDKQC